MCPGFGSQLLSLSLQRMVNTHVQFRSTANSCALTRTALACALSQQTSAPSQPTRPTSAEQLMQRRQKRGETCENNSWPRGSWPCKLCLVASKRRNKKNRMQANAHSDVTQYPAAESEASIDAALRCREALCLQQITRGSSLILKSSSHTQLAPARCDSQSRVCGRKMFPPFRRH